MVSDIQVHLLENSSDHLPDDIRLLAYILSLLDYRSTLIPIRRAVYHVVPHRGIWLLKRRGEDHGQPSRTKREAVAAVVKIARSHTHGNCSSASPTAASKKKNAPTEPTPEERRVSSQSLDKFQFVAPLLLWILPIASPHPHQEPVRKEPHQQLCFCALSGPVLLGEEAPF